MDLICGSKSVKKKFQNGRFFSVSSSCIGKNVESSKASTSSSGSVNNSLISWKYFLYYRIIKLN